MFSEVCFEGKISKKKEKKGRRKTFLGEGKNRLSSLNKKEEDFFMSLYYKNFQKFFLVSFFLIKKGNLFII
jgi:hypothetical protein